MSPESSRLKGPVLICLAGLPAAGKSFFAERLASCLYDEYGVKNMIVASDSVRSEIPALRNDFLPELETAVRKMTLDRVRSALAAGFTVIHDDLNYYRSMRFELVCLSREQMVPYVFIHISTPKETCLKQNEDRGFKIPNEVIQRDSARFDPPGEDPWDEPAAVVKAPDFDDPAVRDVAEIILDKARTFTPWTPPEPTHHESSLSEELDLLARRIVSDLYRMARPRVDSKEISARRHALVSTAVKLGKEYKEAENLFRDELGALFE
ncbi:MAG: AAA family ATPase [Planctomycetota bacterium]